MTPPSSGAAPHSVSAEAGADFRTRLRASLLIGLCCFLIYNSNLRSISAGDTYPARFLPFSIVQYHTLFLDPIVKVAAQGRGDSAFWMLHRPDGHIMSFYPVVLPLLVSPLYVPAVVYLHRSGWSDTRLDHFALVMEKLVSSLLAALSVALLYWLLRRRASQSVALLLTIAYAFGTTTWVISSQALWQHGIAQLLMIGALLLITSSCTTARAVVAGLLLGLIGGNRPPDVILGAALGVYALFFWAGKRRALPLIAASALPMLMVLIYNLRVAGNIGGGYGLIGKPRFFQHALLPGVSALLVSPTRGLLVFSPFLLFLLLLGWKHLPGDRNERRLTLVMTVGVVLQFMLYAKTDWRSGLSWGPRYMTDLLPMLMWMLVPVVAALRGAGRMLFIFMVGVAVVIEAIGAFTYTWSLDLPIYAVAEGPSEMDAAWKWKNAPFVAGMRQGLFSGDLFRAPQGGLDGIETGGHAITEVIAGQQASATGWALAGDETPWQIAINVDGHLAGSTRSFSDRPDVRAALHETSRSGWSIPLDTKGIAPGRHDLTVLIWGAEKGEGHYLGGRELVVSSADASAPVASSNGVREAATTQSLPGDEDLTESSRQAALRIREHQQVPGYWLTSYTTAPEFREPRREMNTFLTSLLVDLLAPVAAERGLEENLQRARQHLTSQIESNGPVRYHGLPDAPTIGTLGCAITPDTDDTALVWRIAPGGDRARLTSALSIIDGYRTEQGLYRSWLAQRSAFQCLDPGSDPNPADVAIQMHLLLLLSEARPAAGHALCEALRPAIAQDRLWVYYAKTPLVPILRLPDLRRAGCALTLPESRMRSNVAGQEIWLSVARLMSGAAPHDASVMRALLRELARNDFALLRTNPPLLYHNDLTATVSRYYWSEDAGYALWLKLHGEYEHARGPAIHL